MLHKFQFPTRLESKMISRPSAVQASLRDYPEFGDQPLLTAAGDRGQIDLAVIADEGQLPSIG